MYRPVIVRREVIVVHRYYAPRVIVVRKVVHPHRGWYHGRWNRVVAYYDYRSGRYYDRYDRRMRGLREVRLYERGGQYYDVQG